MNSMPLPQVDGVRHGFALVRGARLHYAEAGAGEPLVLLHGWPQHWWSFRHVIAPLATRYRVICPDVRGLGWSTGSPLGHRFLELAADLVSLLDALQLKRVRLVGHDWGAAIGYTTCLQWPERVHKYVALGAATPWSGASGFWPLFLRAWHISALALLGRFALGALALPRYVLARWRHVGKFSDDEVRTYLEPLTGRDAARATVRYYRNLIVHEIPYFIRHYESVALRTPTLHLNGAQDPLTQGVPTNYGKYAGDMRLELIANCGHFIAEEQPEELTTRLQSFFA